MKKVLFIGGGILILAFILGYLYITNTYHSTYQEALEELKRTEEGNIIQLPDQSVLIVNKKGMISFAVANRDYLFQWYEDFTVYPTNLNVFDPVIEKEIPYVNLGGAHETTVGLLKNNFIEYVGYNGGHEEGISFDPTNANKVIHLEKHVKDSRAAEIKIWFVFAGVVPQQVSNVYFFNKDKEKLSLERALFKQK